MSEGSSSAQTNQRRESPRRKLEVDPMFKKILMTAAALSALTFGASAANAHYSSYGYNYGYSYNYRPAYSYSYNSYQPSCYYKTIPVTIRVWDDYYCEYTYRTVYRSVKSCY
jgi:hypothetical protein